MKTLWGMVWRKRWSGTFNFSIQNEVLTIFFAKLSSLSFHSLYFFASAIQPLLFVRSFLFFLETIHFRDVIEIVFPSSVGPPDLPPCSHAYV